MRTTTTRYFLISFYLSPSLRVTCIILRFFFDGTSCRLYNSHPFLSLSLSLARLLSISLFSLLFPSLTQFSSVRTSLHHCADFRHSYRWAILDACVCVCMYVCIYVRSLEDCFFPKLLHVYMCKPCVLWNEMTNIRVDQHFFDRLTFVSLSGKGEGDRKKREKRRRKWIFLLLSSSCCDDENDDEQDHRSLLSL